MRGENALLVGAKGDGLGFPRLELSAYVITGYFQPVFYVHAYCFNAHPFSDTNYHWVWAKFVLLCLQLNYPNTILDVPSGLKRSIGIRKLL